MALPSIWSLLGGDATSSSAPIIDAQTGEIMDVGAIQAKHPFLSKMSGKAEEIDKVNQLMKMLQLQQNAKVGNQRLTHAQDIDKLGQIHNISLLDKTGQPFNSQTSKGLGETEYNPQMLELLRGAIAEQSKASAAASGSVRQKADLERNRDAQRTIDVIRNPKKTVEQDDRSFEANLLKVLAPETTAISPTGEKGSFSNAAFGSWTESLPIFQKYGDTTLDTGKSREVTHQGGVFVSPERLKAVRMGSTKLNPEVDFNPAINPRQYPQGMGPFVNPTEHKVDPASLGIKISARPSNYQINPGWGSILKDMGLDKALLQRLGILAN